MTYSNSSTKMISKISIAALFVASFSLLSCATPAAQNPITTAKQTNHHVGRSFASTDCDSNESIANQELVKFHISQLLNAIDLLGSRNDMKKAAACYVIGSAEGVAAVVGTQMKSGKYVSEVLAPASIFCDGKIYPSQKTTGPEAQARIGDWPADKTPTVNDAIDSLVLIYNEFEGTQLSNSSGQSKTQ